MPMLPAVQDPSRALDADSRRWLDGLRASDPERLEKLHGLLLRTARREVGRRSGQLGGARGAELDDLAHQATGDAMLSIVGRLDSFRGDARFTTWATMFVIHELSLKLRRHLWAGRRVDLDDVEWDRLPERLGGRPDRATEDRAQLAALRAAVDETLTERQRQVFTAIALNDVPIDIVAERFGATRGAIYKSLHDARSKLRASLADAGYPLDREAGA